MNSNGNGYYRSANLKYFPRNLEKVFKNLETFAIQDSNLIELTSEDLKPFLKLTALCLDGYPIEIIRENLFIHNPELEVLYIASNKINHIDPNALSHLNNLKSIYFFDNICKLSKVLVETRSGILEIVKEIEQGKCQSPSTTSTATTTTENPLILQINQLKQQIEEQQEEISKLKNESIEKEQNNKKLTEENKKYQKIIDKQEKQLKEQKTQNQNLTKTNQEMKSNLKVFEAKNEEMEKNIEKILKISEKYFEIFESQSSDLTNFYSKCNNDKLLEKSDKIIEKLENCESLSQNDSKNQRKIR
ncbi:hypothetical protein PVAND_009210 [Polypedilum vanderplanki]|uniref:Uncharacterized protein n=1 Tax=Polypedilum vanderplanki TaxID=319348 RepID=A0A9J6CCE7_POLVA|nr:hypothetical protein PVAND_009210 [Polypedilum vanderplanki]